MLTHALVTPPAAAAGTVMTVFLVAVLVLGYVVLWVIWRLFFRRPAGRPDREAPPDA